MYLFFWYAESSGKQLTNRDPLPGQLGPRGCVKMLPDHPLTLEAPSLINASGIIMEPLRRHNTDRLVLL